MRLLFLIAFVFLLCNFSEAQSGWGAGACGIYNAAEKKAGAGGRVLIPFKDKAWAVPYFYYYFPTKEFSGGLSAMVPFYRSGMFTFYGLASATLRVEASVTVNDSTVSESSTNKAEGEIGAGVLIGYGCLKGMIEPRYAVGGDDLIIRAGAVYFFHCKPKKRPRAYDKKKKWREGDYSNVIRRNFCPAYD